ncbi:hypothetical protein SAICODRAFT_32098 [Saitoella complicata NRRL Y-17804]|uniref:uncharacterized protein n=1 Tax=Saitoella complicata (strain BCRC 22490 / CBS 7301 / JCM 7358 / NBRC 10748 / NRRL Y-17804) TaxID=698492 RepID=UPI00086743E4|nr:uncharacterized protein SAICODRAFT_32098 [Saitoella complicata NRRL Y-17804]ODQ50138.1 hypothetical protein SAICODRAFT_32098 [Saitoella complicata NRRL Y-17804]
MQRSRQPFQHCLIRPPSRHSCSRSYGDSAAGLLGGASVGMLGGSVDEEGWVLRLKERKILFWDRGPRRNIGHVFFRGTTGFDH